MCCCCDRYAVRVLLILQKNCEILFFRCLFVRFFSRVASPICYNNSYFSFSSSLFLRLQTNSMLLFENWISWHFVEKWHPPTNDSLPKWMCDSHRVYATRHIAILAKYFSSGMVRCRSIQFNYKFDHLCWNSWLLTSLELFCWSTVSIRIFENCRFQTTRVSFSVSQNSQSVWIFLKSLHFKQLLEFVCDLRFLLVGMDLWIMSSKPRCISFWHFHTEFCNRIFFSVENSYFQVYMSKVTAEVIELCISIVQLIMSHRLANKNILSNSAS